MSAKLLTTIYLGTLVVMLIAWFLGINININVDNSTLSLLELAWLVVNALGALYSVVNIDSSRWELAEARRQKPVDPYEVLAAYGGLRIDGILLVLQISFLVIGLSAALTPPPRTEQVQSLAAIVITHGFIGSSLLLFYLSYSLRRDRRIFKYGGLKTPQSETASEKPAKGYAAFNGYYHTSAGENGPQGPAQTHTGHSTGEDTPQQTTFIPMSEDDAGEWG